MKFNPFQFSIQFILGKAFVIAGMETFISLVLFLKFNQRCQYTEDLN